MADTDKLVEQLSNLSVLEIAGLVKQLEEKWGVSAGGASSSRGGTSSRGHLAEQRPQQPRRRPRLT